jgi:hypothetical protein
MVIAPGDPLVLDDEGNVRRAGPDACKSLIVGVSMGAAVAGGMVDMVSHDTRYKMRVSDG